MKHNFITFLFFSVMATICVVFMGVLLPHGKRNLISESIQEKLIVNTSKDIIPSFNASFIISKDIITEKSTTEDVTPEYTTIKEKNKADLTLDNHGKSTTTLVMDGINRNGTNKTEDATVKEIKKIPSAEPKDDLSSFTSENNQILKKLTKRPIYIAKVQYSAEVEDEPWWGFSDDWYMHMKK